MRPGHAVLLLVIAPVACSRPAPPESYIYGLRFPPGSVPDGVGLYRGDELLDVVSANPASVGGPAPAATADFRLPAKTWLSALEQPLTLRAPTPCGLGDPVAVEISLTREAEELRRVDATESTWINSEASIAAVRWPAAAELWVDRGSETYVEVSVGSAKLASDHTRGTKVFDLGCAPSHPVTYQGKPIGTFAAPSPGGDEVAQYLVVPDPALCYREHDAFYAPMGTPPPAFVPPDVILTGAPIHRLRSRPTYFLVSAPGRAEGDGLVHELTRIPCS